MFVFVVVCSRFVLAEVVMYLMLLFVLAFVVVFVCLCLLPAWCMLGLFFIYMFDSLFCVV